MMTGHETKKTDKDQPVAGDAAADTPAEKATLKEIGGPDGPEPTRFGDWERNGRCYDF